MNIVATLAVVSCAVAGAAGTTPKPVETSPDEVQRRLLSEQLVKPGGRAKIVTKEEAVHEFRVAEVDLERGLLVGASKIAPPHYNSVLFL